MVPLRGTAFLFLAAGHVKTCSSFFGPGRGEYDANVYSITADRMWPRAHDFIPTAS